MIAFEYQGNLFKVTNSGGKAVQLTKDGYIVVTLSGAITS